MKEECTMRYNARNISLRGTHLTFSTVVASSDNVNTYVLEDLTGINTLKEKGRSNKTMRSWLSSWSYRELEFMLTYKCKAKGINVVFVRTEYTSLTCSKCGNVDKKSRRANHYKCTSCGFETHADVNAAINIKNKYITQVQKLEQGSVNNSFDGRGTVGKTDMEDLQSNTYVQAGSL